ncbi:hypothetical protein [Tropicimonas sp. IMCC6043]|uniref:hypothetical protein n=1 Tax=Tropicimonas sp. IMCC6043 TaxID=2510645 RepID=UPI00101B9E67|nr:hypothetical protein [Tropicimonas sp. IMCC6043]RYH07877.1 hypothetical protein EU800_18730 [Tropicimonas sp. IMCC6043]
MSPLKMSWDHGVAWVEPVGAMLGPVEFRMADGTTVSPLATAPWGNDVGPEHDALPPQLKRLRGEWPCVPFGAPTAPAGLPAQWQARRTSGTGVDFHGFSSQNTWDCVEHAPGRVVLEIAYPQDHAIAGLRREIHGLPGEAEIEISLTISARADVALPIALHPVFAVPEMPSAAEIRADGMRGGRSYPIATEPGVSRLIPDQGFDSLASVPATGGALSLNRLPLPFDTEEIVQLFGADGRITLRNHAEGYEAWVAYDPEVFPSVLLWISNRGRSAYPWNGRFSAVGIEPVRGAFDLGPEIGANPQNPIAKAGIPTALTLSAGKDFVTTYRIGASRL